MPFVAKSAAPREPHQAAAHWAFDQAASGGLTLFTAPPGYVLAEGLFQTLQRQGRRVPWVRLGPEDRDPGTFLLSVVAAVQRQQPGFGRSTLELMRRQPGPVAGWPHVFTRLAAELSESMVRPAALVVEHAHHLGPATPTLALLGGEFLRALDGDTACVLISHEELPATALPAHTVRRSSRDLRLPASAAQALLEHDAAGLGRESAQQAAWLCDGAVATLTGVYGASAALGAGVVERAIRRASRAQDLLASLARAWLETIGPDRRRALSLALRLEYSHPALTTAVLGETAPPHGPWLQPLVDEWSRVRTVWRDPLRSVLAKSRLLGPEVVHRAADYLLDQGAAERAIPLYLDLRDPGCAAHALATEADQLVDLGQWDTLRGWLARLPDSSVGDEPRLLCNQAEIATAGGRVEAAERGFSAATSLFAARYDPAGACRSMLAESALAAGRNDLARARARAEAASALAGVAGLDRQQVWASWQLGCVAVAAEDMERALAHFGRAAAVASRLGERFMADLVLEVERLGSRLQQLQRERRHHWEAWTSLQHAEREVADRILEHTAGAPDRAEPLLGAYGWSQTPLAFKVPTHEPPAPPEPPPRGPVAPRLAVRLLGQFRVSLNEVAVVDWPSRRGRSLFKYLVTHRDPWPQREVLMEVFWPGSRPEGARNSLNVAVHGLRRALRAVNDVPVVVLHGGAYRLAADLQIWVDVEEFERHVEGGRRLEGAGQAAAAIAEYELAVSLYQGEFLADDPYEEWPVVTREHLLVTYLDLLDRLSRLYFAQGGYAASAALCRRIIERDACREDAHRRLLRCYSRQGRPHLALRQYRACADALRAELGVDPAPTTVQLQEAIRRHQPV